MPYTDSCKAEWTQKYSHTNMLRQVFYMYAQNPHEVSLHHCIDDHSSHMQTQAAAHSRWPGRNAMLSSRERVHQGLHAAVFCKLHQEAAHLAAAIQQEPRRPITVSSCRDEACREPDCHTRTCTQDIGHALRGLDIQILMIVVLDKTCRCESIQLMTGLDVCQTASLGWTEIFKQPLLLTVQKKGWTGRV